MINQYSDNYNRANEVALSEQLIIEAIQMKGTDVHYIERTHNNFDEMFGEDPTSSFSGFTAIEMYMVEVSGFGGDGEMLAKFGLEEKDTVTFQVSIARWETEFPDIVKPNEGDLIFMPTTNALFEVKFVHTNDYFFYHGKPLVYTVKCENFTPSHEEIDVGNIEVDAMFDRIISYDQATEVGDLGDNETLKERANNTITFDPSDPFGVA